MLIVEFQRSDMDLSFSEWLKIRRSRIGVTQGAIAAQLGVKPQTVSNWENNVSTPSLNPKQMLRLCKLLDVSLEELAIAYGDGQDD